MKEEGGISWRDYLSATLLLVMIAAVFYWRFLGQLPDGTKASNWNIIAFAFGAVLIIPNLKAWGLLLKHYLPKAEENEKTAKQWENVVGFVVLKSAVVLCGVCIIFFGGYTALNFALLGFTLSLVFGSLFTAFRRLRR